MRVACWETLVGYHDPIKVVVIFPSGPMVRIVVFHTIGLGSIPS